jgi:hypothetical protein
VVLVVDVVVSVVADAAGVVLVVSVVAGVVPVVSVVVASVVAGVVVSGAALVVSVEVVVEVSLPLSFWDLQPAKVKVVATAKPNRVTVNNLDFMIAPLIMIEIK